jgi:hypothetical protein
MADEKRKRIPREAQDEKGRFLPNNPGGVGRNPNRSPLHKAITSEKAESLWAGRLAVAEGGPETRYGAEGVSWDDWSRVDGAAEFILRYKNGSPPAATPDIPPIAWPAVEGVDDLAKAAGAMLNAHAAGVIDGAGLKFLTGIIVDLAKVFEVTDLGPKLRKLEEYVEAQGGSL